MIYLEFNFIKIILKTIKEENNDLITNIPCSLWLHNSTCELTQTIVSTIYAYAYVLDNEYVNFRGLINYFKIHPWWKYRIGVGQT